MKKRIFILLLVFAMFGTTMFMSISSVSAQGYVGTIKSQYIEGSITLDGRKDAVWNNGTESTFTLFNFESPTIEQNITIASVYNNVSLYLWISVDDLESEATMFLIFQTNLAADLILDYTVPTWTDGNDIKTIDSNNNSIDEFILDDSALVDTNYGGTNDTNGKTWSRPDGFNFEVVMPLNSTDTAGGDFSLQMGDSINFFPHYIANGGYGLIHKTNGTWELINLVLEEPSEDPDPDPDPLIPSYSIPIVIVSAVAVSALLIFKTKRK